MTGRPVDPAADPAAALAEAIRMLAAAALIDHSGHGSVRRDALSFYINSGRSVRRTLGPADIVCAGLDGGLVAGAANPPLEVYLHGEIYRARPEVGAVLHTHPRWSTFLTMVGAPFTVVYPQGALLGDVPMLDSPLSIGSAAMGERVAAALGQGPAVLLKSHGAVIVGATLVEAFALATYLEENAYRQYMAMQIGTPYVLSAAEQEACRARLGTPGLFQKAWDHHRAELG